MLKDGNPPVPCFEAATYDSLAEILRLGLKGISRYGVEAVFGPNMDSSASYLCDIAWNAGREAGEAEEYELWSTFFELSYDFGSFRAGMCSRSEVCCADLAGTDPFLFSL